MSPYFESICSYIYLKKSKFKYMQVLTAKIFTSLYFTEANNFLFSNEIKLTLHLFA